MRPVPHRVTNVGNGAIRDRLHQWAGHGEQAQRLRQEARILTAVLDAGTRG